MQPSQSSLHTIPSSPFTCLVVATPELRLIERFKQEMVSTKTPGVVLESYRRQGIFEKILPEMAALWGPFGIQDPRWHPEGNTFEHTKLVVDELVGRSERAMLAGIFHDIGKPYTFFRWPTTNGISNHGHEHVK